jgi:hypothetical protein
MTGPFGEVREKFLLREIEDWMTDFTRIESTWEMLNIEFDR